MPFTSYDYQMYNELRKKLKEIHLKEEDLLRDLKRRNLDKEEFLQRNISLQKEILKIAEVYDSLSELEQRLEEDFGSELAKEVIKHEKQHVKIAEGYGLSSKFFYVPSIFEIAVATWPYDFLEKAKKWSFDKIERFIKDIGDVKEPSDLDKRYANL